MISLHDFLFEHVPSSALHQDLWISHVSDVVAQERRVSVVEAKVARFVVGG